MQSCQPETMETRLVLSVWLSSCLCLMVASVTDDQSASQDSLKCQGCKEQKLARNPLQSEETMLEMMRSWKRGVPPQKALKRLWRTGWRACQVGSKSWVPALHYLDKLVHTCDTSTREVRSRKTRISE